MKKDFTSFEKSIKEGLGDFEMPFDARQWENLEMRLDGRSASSLNTMAAAVVTALIFVSGVTYFTLNKLNNSEGVANTTAVENSQNTISQTNTVQLENDDLSNVDNQDAVPTVISENTNQSNLTEVIEDETSESNTSSVPADKIKTPSSSTNNNTVLVDVDAEDSDRVENLEDDSSSESLILDDGSPMISVSAREVCAGEKIEFTAENITDESKFLWNFGNADFSTEISPVRSFSAPGEYNISLILSKSSRKIESKIIVLPQPLADFTWREEELGLIRLSNKSEKAGISVWKMDHEEFSSEINPSFDYHEEGKVLINLRVENEFGCADSSLKYIKLKAPVVVTAPEVFKQGESFAPSMQNPNEGVMSLSIHNMRGQLIYESESGESWDGTMPDGTFAAPNSEFPWLIRVKNLEGKEIYSDSGKVKVLP